MYMNKWSPHIGGEFQVEIEELNRHNRYAVAVKVNEDIVGHVPKKHSKVFYYFIRYCGMISFEFIS